MKQVFTKLKKQNLQVFLSFVDLEGLWHKLKISSDKDW